MVVMNITVFGSENTVAFSAASDTPHRGKLQNQIWLIDAISLFGREKSHSDRWIRLAKESFGTRDGAAIMMSVIH